MRTKLTKKNRFIPSFDALESREVMSVTAVSLDAGTLHVVCDGGNDNVSITRPISPILTQFAQTTTTAPTTRALAFNGGGLSIFNTIKVQDLTKTANNTWTFSASDVKSIEIDAGAGDDWIVSTVNKPTTVYGGLGNDHIETGAANDYVSGGGGNDAIFTHEGNDLVYGGAGDDAIVGGAGNDTLNGNSGNNSIFGGDGDDLIDGGINNTLPPVANLLYGEGGNDTIYSHNRNDVVDGGAGYDSFRVKAGTWVVRYGENVNIDVPLGSAATVDKASAVNAGFRFLRSYGYNPIGGAILNDSTWGLSPSRLRDFLKNWKSDTTLETGSNLQRVLDLVGSGKPVIVQTDIVINNTLHHRYVVVNGFDLATQTIKFVDIDGLQHSNSFFNFNYHWGKEGRNLLF